MAETSGFFQAMVDEEINDYDRKYLAKQFADYFSLFVGNGVFANPTNQLMVVPGTGLSVVVKPGYAFINGYWYWNSTDKVVPLVPNYGTGNRTDTVRVRMSEVTRNMTVDVYTGDTELVRGEDVYDLQLASITVQPMAETLLASAVQDTRPNEQVCGFVTGLLRVETTKDLFDQFKATFDEWFDGIKGELEGIDVGQLLNKVNDLEDSVDADLTEMRGELDRVSDEIDKKIDDYIFDQNQLINNLSLENYVAFVYFQTSDVTIQYSQEIDLIPALQNVGRNAYDVMQVVVRYYSDTNSYCGAGTVTLQRDTSWTASIAGRFPLPSRSVYQKNSDGTYVQLTDSAKMENPLYSRKLSLGMAGENYLKLKIEDCYLYEENTNGIWYANTNKVVPRCSVVTQIAMICWPRMKKEG